MNADVSPIRALGLLALTVGLAMLPSVLNLGKGELTRHMEELSVLSSHETWVRQRVGARPLLGLEDASDPRVVATTIDLLPANSPIRAEGGEPSGRAWLIPTLNGGARVNKPPLVVWSNLLAWSGLDAESAASDALMMRARLMGLVMLVLTVAGTFWAGWSLEGPRTAVLGGLVVGSTLMLLRQAHYATYDSYQLAWVTLTVAGALHAMRPGREAGSSWARWAIGWGAAGVALGLAMLSKGMPLALVLTLAPIVAMIVAWPNRRRRALVGLLAATAVGFAIASPWYLYVSIHVPAITSILGSEWDQERAIYQPPWYYLGLFGLVFPWTLWLIGGLFTPFVKLADRRRMMLLAWLWFVTIFVLLSLHEAKQQRYILPALPPASLMVAQLWVWHRRLADRGERDPGVNLLRVPHWLALAVASVGLPTFLALQPALVDRGWIDAVEMRVLGPVVAGLIAAGLLAVAALGAWLHWRWRPLWAAALTAVWGLAAFGLFMHAYYGGPAGQNPYRDHVRRIAAEVRQAPLLQIARGPEDRDIGDDTLFYLRRIVRMVDRDAVERLRSLGATVYVASTAEGEGAPWDGVAGVVHLFDFADRRDPARRALYRFEPAPNDD